MKKFILFLFLLLTTNLFSQDYESYEILQRKTMSEILNYSGDKSLIKKVIIEDSIKGTDYSEGSEWREFRVLDTTFPNIEAVEIWTDQDIPDNHKVNDNCWLYLFSIFFGEYENGLPKSYSSLWLKYFSAPNIKKVGDAAFINCKNLLSVNFPVAEVIGVGVWSWCESLTKINFSKVKSIGRENFIYCYNLTSVHLQVVEIVGLGAFAFCNNLNLVNFGLDFTREIKFGIYVFGDDLPYNSAFGPILTPNIDLVINKDVIPNPDTAFNIWQNTNDFIHNNLTNYIWKSITIQPVGIEEEIDNSSIYYLGDNRYRLENIKEAGLYDLLGRRIMDIYEQEYIDLNDLTSGVYFLKYTLDNETKTKKLIRN